MKKITAHETQHRFVRVAYHASARPSSRAVAQLGLQFEHGALDRLGRPLSPLGG